jgi:hypothetical protein
MADGNPDQLAHGTTKSDVTGDTGTYQQLPNNNGVGPDAPYWAKLMSQFMRLLSQVMTVGGILGLLSVLVTCTVLYMLYQGSGRLYDMGDRFVESQVKTGAAVAKASEAQTGILATMQTDASKSREKMNEVVAKMMESDGKTKDAIESNGRAIATSLGNDGKRLELIESMKELLVRMDARLPQYPKDITPARVTPYVEPPAPARAP